MSGLFRRQAIDAQKQKLHGDISLAQPISIYTTSFTLVFIVSAIILFLSFSHYARKETVRGYLVPDKGLIKTYANRSGNIDKLHVSEGDIVKSGAPLVSRLRFSSSHRATKHLSKHNVKQFKLRKILCNFQK
ncbi:hypothetical protein TUM4261_29170 [Shewanella sp. c952]|nr:hypothetical protein TUM4261_29170 [Shewanella sp. c952]